MKHANAGIYPYHMPGHKRNVHGQMPEEIIAAAKQYDPARLTKYVLDAATLFHKFYNSCRVKGEDEALMQARLSLCLAAQTVIRNSLNLLKITAPEVM